MKNIKFKSIIVLLLSLGMMGFIIAPEYNNIINTLKNVNLFWLICSVILYYIGFIIETKVLQTLIRQYKTKYTFRKSFRLNTITKFFNGITPLASGGQPLQVYELTKDDIKVSNGTNIIVENFLLYQIALIILSVICYVVNLIFKLVTLSSFISKMILLGFLLNLFLLIFAYIVGFNKKINKAIVFKTTKLLHKLKIIKEKDKLIEKLEITCNDFYNGFYNLRKNHILVLKGILYQFIALILNFLVLIFIFKALSITISSNIIGIIVAGTFIFLAGSYVPIPGGTGGMEYAYIKVIGSFIKGSPLSSSLILWRFITYIMPVIIGGITFNIKSE
ncbi:MAG: lysylphosphatidylglycerol synthase transmembrane domain-containing protein [Bacilli bacterium]